MRADVVFYCMFSFRLLPFMRDSIFVITLFKENIYWERFFFPPSDFLNFPKSGSSWVQDACGPGEVGNISEAIFTRVGFKLPCRHSFATLLFGAVPYSTPIPTSSALSKHGLRLQDHMQIRKYCG